MSRHEFGRKLRHLLRLLVPVLTEAEYDDVTGFWGQSEWDLALDLAARLILEHRRPITHEIYTLLAELIAEGQYQTIDDLDGLRALVAEPAK
jgi:hypothetical protein